MSKIGSIGWTDLSINNAIEVRDFYKAVVGFEHTSVDMGGYDDFNMNSPEDGETQVGICHAQDENKDIPPVWIVYFFVEDMGKSLRALKEHGGELLGKIKSMGNDQYAFIKDPGGAVCALYQKNATNP